MGSGDTLNVVWWSMLVFLFGIGLFPLTARIFGKFGTGGFIISQALGIILTSLVIWTFTYMQITRFNLPCVIGVYAVIAAACWGIKPLRKAALAKLSEPVFVERAVLEETAFVVIFCLMCYFKGFLSEINGQEKYMDYGFILSMLRNDTLPAKDMWLSGNSINYYYFGQFLWALVIKCSMIKPAIAYNIAMCTATALPFAMAFSFGTMLIETAIQHGFHDSPIPKYLGGTLTAFAVSIWGNSHSFFYDPDSIGNNIVPVFAKLGCEVGDYKNFFYPDSTRYIGYNPKITNAGGDFTIEEFPFYSYLIGDLHAHVISMMIVLVIACLMLAFINSAAYPNGAEMKLKRTLANLKAGGRLAEEFKVTLTLPFILSAVLLGVAQMTNYWDFLFYFIFISMASLIVNVRISKVFTDLWGAIYFVMNTAFILSFYLLGGSNPLLLISLEAILMVFAYLFSVLDPCALTRTSFQMSFMFTIAHVAALPFNLKFDMISNSLSRVINNSTIYQLFILWGTHVIIGVVFFVWVLVTKNYRLSGGKGKAAPSGDVVTEDMNHNGWTNPVQKFFGTRNIADVFVCGIVVVGIMFIIAPEIFYVKDIYTDGYLRSNTMFKFTFAAFIMLSEAMCYAATRLIWFVNKKGLYSTPALITGFVSIILMVIPGHYPLAALQQREILHLIGAVGVDNDEQRMAVRPENRLVRGDDSVAVLLVLIHQLKQGLCRRVRAVEHDLAGRFELARDAADADGSAERVQIRDAVPHDEDAGGILDELAQGVCHDAGFDLGARFDLAAAPAVELEVHAIFEHGLIAAAAERHVDAEHGEVEVLLIAGAVAPDAHGERGADADGVDDAVHALEQGAELVRAHGGEIAVLENEEIAVAVIVTEEAVLPLAPLQELILDLLDEIVALAVGQTADELVVVVDDEEGDVRAGIVILPAQRLVLRDVYPVGDGHDSGLVLLRADEVAVHLIFPILDLHEIGAAAVPVHKPAAGEPGDDVRDAHLHRGAAHAADLEEGLVRPDDLRIRRAEDRHRQGEVLQRAALRRVRGEGDALDIALQRLAVRAARNQRIDDERENDPHLRQRQPQTIREKERGDGKEDEKDQKQSGIRHECLRDFHRRGSKLLLRPVRPGHDEPLLSKNSRL